MLQFDPELKSQEIFKEHNKFRTNPKSYIPKLQSWLTKFRDNTLYLVNEKNPLLTFEGTDGVYEAINYLRKQDGSPELQYSKDLSSAAQDHANDIGKNGLTSHEGSNGSDLTSRIEQYIEWDGSCAESIDFGFTEPCNIICNLIVDDGVREKFQRNYLLSKEFKYIGIGVSKHRDFGFCVVLVYAQDIRSKGVLPKERFDYIQDYIEKTYYKKNPVNEFQVDDIDAPDNTVSVKVLKMTKLINGEERKFTKKIYMLEDKTQHIVEIEEN
ncbi:MAG: CAP domain-containing protein [archaeon]|nr:CAP domain-containing protein [archaeon]